jgi:glycosyltransferase involved in cell wall biosynthesis
MKIAVYTIALNEAAHVERWAASAADADYRIVCDTGSTDDTVERLTGMGVTVHRIAIRPWRFDDARNAALSLLPDDVEVCCTLDMDRYFEAGWRAQLESAWTPGTTSLFCRIIYPVSLDDPTPLRDYRLKLIHGRWGHRWRRAVHEAIFCTDGEENTKACDSVIVREVQEPNRETRRRYLPLMEVALKEDPSDSQICFWLGREYMWADRHAEAAETFERYLALRSSVWADERSEAMRFLAAVQPDRRIEWLERARAEAPHRREIWNDLAEELHTLGDWPNLFWACINGIERTRRTGTYLDDLACWGPRLFDLGSIAAWHLNVIDRAVEWGRRALDLAAGDERLKTNLDFYIQRQGEVSTKNRDRELK